MLPPSAFFNNIINFTILILVNQIDGKNDGKFIVVREEG